MSRRGGRGGGRGGSKSTLSSSKELLKRSATEAGLDDRHMKVLSDITRPPLFPDFLWKSTGHYWNEIDFENETGTVTTAELLSLPDQRHRSIKTESTETSTSTVVSVIKNNNTKLSTSMMSLIQKQRELTKRYQYSSYYIRPTTTVDIVRYADRRMDVVDGAQQQRTPDASILTSLSVTKTNLTHGATRINDINPSIIASSKYFPEELLPIKKTKKILLKRHPNGPFTITPNTSIAATTTAQQQEVAMKKLETLDHEEISGKLRTTSITSITSTDDLMLTSTSVLPTKVRKSSEVDETTLGEMEGDEEDDDNDDDNIIEENVEEELGVEDYTTNYYASDDDNDDDDGEPTY